MELYRPVYLHGIIGALVEQQRHLNFNFSFYWIKKWSCSSQRNRIVFFQQFSNQTNLSSIKRVAFFSNQLFLLLDLNDDTHNSPVHHQSTRKSINENKTKQTKTKNQTTLVFPVSSSTLLDKHLSFILEWTRNPEKKLAFRSEEKLGKKGFR